MKIIRNQLVAIVLTFLYLGLNGQVIPSFVPAELEKEAALHPKITDVDKDGINDIVMVCNYTDETGDDATNIKNICWLKGPDYKKFIIASLNYRACGMAVTDVNSDGFPDVIGLEDNDAIDNNENAKLFVFFNPGKNSKDWRRFDLGEISYAKDIETGDLNGDGSPDIVARCSDMKLHLFIGSKDKWEKTTFEVPPFDGLALGDLDNDGDNDIAINGMWIENKAGNWAKHDYSKERYTQKTGEKGQWNDNNTRVAIADINLDGRLDIVISLSEQKGLPLTWFENPQNPAKTSKWKSHIISDQHHLHSLQLADFDNDGNMDILTGRLIFHTDTIENPHPVTIFYNRNKGEKWETQVVSEKGCYGAGVGDLENDGDIDIVTPRNYNLGPVNIFRNTLHDSKRITDAWKYIEIDTSRSKWGDFDNPEWLRYFGLDASDADGDGDLDLIAGRYFYKNPGGDMSGKWQCSDLGINADGILWVDVDGDLLADCIAEAFPTLWWFEATDNSCTSWTRHKIGEFDKTDHVNGQGHQVAQLVKGGNPEILLSTDKGIVCITIPEKPEEGMWPVFTIAPQSLSEGIGIGDIDGDGDIDISSSSTVEDVGKGINWWENPGNINSAWKQHTIGETPGYADRFKIADINGDKRKDIIVSEERYPGLEPDASLIWFENPGTETKWKQHKVITQYSMNSLDCADLDLDGDIDIVTNEHKGPHQTQVLINDGKGNFTVNTIDIGKESHLGTKLFDLDMDGDPDLVSIAWDNYKYLHLWRNDANNQVQITDGISDEGQDCYRIKTPYATFFFQKEAGGFSSILDKNGADWINFKNSDLPQGPALSASLYRGMPNLLNNCSYDGTGHPGSKSCYSKLINDSTIYVISTNGLMEYTWTFTSKLTYLTMLKPGTECPYWFLYEGTPGGNYDPSNQYWATDKTGFSTACPDLLKGSRFQDNWNWIYFGNKCTNQVLVLSQLIPDDKPELMSYMGNTSNGMASSDGMVVFGFGRFGAQPQLNQPNVFMLSFLSIDSQPESSYSDLSKTIEKLVNELRNKL